MPVLLLLVLVFVLLLIIGMPIFIVLILFSKTRPVVFSLLAGGLILVMFVLLLSSLIKREAVSPELAASLMPAENIEAQTGAQPPPAVRNLLGQPEAAAPQENVGIGSKTSQAPDWVNAAPRSVGDAYQISIVVGPYTTRAECDAQLPATLQKALDSYVEACLGGEIRRRIVLPDDYLRQLVKDQWEEVRQHSFGPMTTRHILLEFDRKAKDRVLDQLRRTKVAGRLWFAGVGWAVWLALLGGVYGYLRIAGSKKSG